MRKIKILLIITLTVLVINCKKDEDVTSSRKDLLSGKSWIMTAETISPAIKCQRYSDNRLLCSGSQLYQR